MTLTWQLRTKSKVDDVRDFSIFLLTSEIFSLVIIQF